MIYRREIDGLRAVAVLPVLVFHAVPEWAPGGYIGVDIFFVISGFLITSILAEELTQRRFSLLRFYERRARRILPALFLVMLVCLPFAWAWMLPYQLKEFGQSLVAVSGFGSNFLFWQQSGYFDTSAELKPLLHTWSLAVEEQYYLLFPLLLAACWRMGRRGVRVLFLVAGIASLWIAEVQAASDRAAAFYLLPARAWELLAGAALALRREAHAPFPLPAPWREAAAFTGLALIAGGIVFFDRRTPFPGLSALVPVAGAALLIAFAHAGTRVGRLLGSRLPVAVGLVSYSLYLWHFPVLAFWKIRTGEMELPAWLLFPYLALVFVAAWASYRFVEAPFRRPGLVSRRLVFGFAGAGIAVFAAAGYLGHASNGFLAHKLASVPAEKRGLLVRVDEEVAARTRIAVAQEPYLLQPAFDPAAGRRIAILGDSLAADFGLALAQHRDLFSGHDFRLLHLRTECLDAAPRAAAENGDACAGRMRELLASPLLREADLVVVTGLWTATLERASIDALLQRLRAMNRELLVLGSGGFLDIPSISYQLARDGRSWAQEDIDALVARSRREKFDRGNLLVEAVARELGIPYRDRHDLYCDAAQSRCRILMTDGRTLIWDNAHLTELGFRATATAIRDLGWLAPTRPADSGR